MKRCSCCGITKTTAEYQKRAASKDGLTSSCKSCLSLRDKARDTPERAAQRKAYQHGVGKEVANAAKKRYDKANPKKRNARVAVGNAVRDGKLIKKCCEVCGGVESFAHHDDYNKPLLVRWLCDLHRKEWHDKHGEAVNRI
jgi:hypothetical protein